MPKPSGEWPREDIEHYRLMGVGTVVSLLEPAEERELFLGPEEEVCQESRIDFLRFPIPDRGLPEAEGFACLVAEIVARLRREQGVAVHCRAGIGRSRAQSDRSETRIGKIARPNKYRSARPDFIRAESAPAWSFVVPWLRSWGRWRISWHWSARRGASLCPIPGNNAGISRILWAGFGTGGFDGARGWLKRSDFFAGEGVTKLLNRQKAFLDLGHPAPKSWAG